MATLSTRNYLEMREKNSVRACVSNLKTISLKSLLIGPRIAHISDLHFSASAHTLDVKDGLPTLDNQPSAQKREILASWFKNHAKRLGVSHVVITGDLTDSGDEADWSTAAAFLRDLKDCGLGVHSIPGNHDYCKEGNFIIAYLLFLSSTDPIQIMEALGLEIPSWVEELHDLFGPDWIFELAVDQLSDLWISIVEAILPSTSAGVINSIAWILMHPNGDHASNALRQDRFVDNATNYRDYPHIAPIDNGYLVLLDSMQQILRQGVSVSLDPCNISIPSYYLAQGWLGSEQLDALENQLANLQSERAKGKRVILAMHHSPFCDDSKMALVDRERFLKIVKNRIDAMLIGHTGAPADSSSYSGTHSIPIINIENLEQAAAQYPISIIDLGANQVHVFSPPDPG